MRSIYSSLIAASGITACAPELPIASIPIEIVDGNPITSANVGGQRIDLIIDTGGFGGIAIAPEDLGRLNDSPACLCDYLSRMAFFSIKITALAAVRKFRTIIFTSCPDVRVATGASARRTSHVWARKKTNRTLITSR